MKKLSYVFTCAFVFFCIYGSGNWGCSAPPTSQDGSPQELSTPDTASNDTQSPDALAPDLAGHDTSIHEQPATETPVKESPAELAPEPTPEPTPPRSWQAHPKEVSALAFSPDGQTLASADTDKHISLWRVSDNQLIREISPDQFIYSLAFSHDGKVIGGRVGASSLMLLQVEDGKTMLFLDQSLYNSFAISPKENLFVFGEPYEKVRIMGFDGKLIREFKNAENSIFALAFSPDGKTIAAGSSGGVVELGNTSDGNKLRSFQKTHKGERIRTIAFSSDGHVASGAEDNTVVLWKASDGSMLHTIDTKPNYTYYVTFSPDGKYLATLDDSGKARLWKVSDASLFKTFEGAAALAFSPDGRTLALGDKQGMIRLLTDPTAP